jgi:cell division protein FtsI/penicillin-binding protein 2
MGDYTGLNGLERTYEKVLMVQRGIKRFIRDNKSRIQEVMKMDCSILCPLLEEIYIQV